MGTTSNFALRLPTSLKKAAEQVAKEDGTTLNQFIAIAVAEKLSALRTSDYLKNRAKRADLPWFDRFMKRKRSAPPRTDDRK
jgi:hypothetical protein